jgi:uncharacterized protein YuzE
MASMKVWYDREGDFLEITFEDALATLEEVGHDIFERRTLDGRVVGFAVMNFSKHDQDKLTLPFEVKVSPAA